MCTSRVPPGAWKPNPKDLGDFESLDALRARVRQDLEHEMRHEAERDPRADLLQQLEFHYTPKHASWLNMVEIEIGVLKGQCLDWRIDTREWLEREIAAWECTRNAARARVRWMFTTENARAKMGRAYPKTTPPEPPAKRS